MGARCRLPTRALLLVLGALLAGAVPLRAQGPVRWQPDERILIGPFAHVVAVASDAWSIHAATIAGLVSYDPATRRWALPLTLEDGYPVHERPTALAAVRGEQVLVLGTAHGSLWRIDPAGRRIERLTTLPGVVQRIVAGEQGNLYVQTPRGWYGLAGGGFLVDALAGEPPAARERVDPRLAALRARIGLDARLRRWPVTGMAAGTRPDEYFVGTAGGGLLRVDALTHEVEPLPFGLASQGVRSILVSTGGVWFGGDGSARGGVNVALADPTLERWEWPGAGAQELPEGRVAAIAEHAGAVWFAADDGLFRHEPGRRSWARYDTRAGLPSLRATALLPADSVLWVGTERGACAWSGATCTAAVLPGQHITTLAVCADRLWFGTGRGLFAAAAGGPPLAIEQPELRAQPIVAIACTGERLAAATPQRLFLGGINGWQEQPQAGARGRISALAADAAALWVAADGGLARRGAEAGEWTYYTAPNDVPLTPIGSLAPAGRYLWLATPGGAVRMDVRR